MWAWLQCQYHLIVAWIFTAIARLLIRRQYPHLSSAERQEIYKWYENAADIKMNWNAYLSGRNSGDEGK